MRNRILAVVLFHGFCWMLPVCFSQQIPESKKNLADDPELLNAMEIFMGMSAQERYETIQGLMETVGHDPAKRAEMETLIKMLPEMDDNNNSDLQKLIRDDEMRKAKNEARRQLDGQDWESFWAMQAEILEATIASGQLSPEDAARFKTDEKAWKAQLKTIFNDLYDGDSHAEL